MDDRISRASSNLSNSVCVSRFLSKVAGNISKSRTPGRLWVQVARYWSFNISFSLHEDAALENLVPFTVSTRGQTDRETKTPPSTLPTPTPYDSIKLWGLVEMSERSFKSSVRKQGGCCLQLQLCSSSCWLTIKRIIKGGAIIHLDPKVFCVTQGLSGHISCVLCGPSAASCQCSVFD